MDKNKGGRRTVVTAHILQRLDDGFRRTYTDAEAALYAGISVRTLYYYQKKNSEFLQRKRLLRLTPNLVAKKVLVESIPGNIEQARWWALHKMRDEFGPKIKVEQSYDNARINVVTGNDKLEPIIQEAIKKIRAIDARNPH